MNNPVVSIIIITCNRAFLLSHCLERVSGQQYPLKEIIVVDSSSNDESEQVVAQFPGVKSVRLRGQRHNMPQARNEGIAASSGDIVAFIDDDSMIYPGWLEALLEVYRDETVGAAGGRIIRKPEPYCDQVSGSPRLLVKQSGVVIAQDTDLVSTARIEVDHLIGCNMSFRRKALEQVGGFDPNYTLTNLREETDLFIRVKRAGWRILFDPAMALIHISARADRYFTFRPRVQFSNGRNTTYFVIKHFGFNPRIMFGQLLDLIRNFSQALFYAGLFIFGALSLLAGRVFGLGTGIAWFISSQRRAAAAPKIGKGDQYASEQRNTITATRD